MSNYVYRTHSKNISSYYVAQNYRGKRMFRDHQTQIKKIVYFPAEFSWE